MSAFYFYQDNLRNEVDFGGYRLGEALKQAGHICMPEFFTKEVSVVTTVAYRIPTPFVSWSVWLGMSGFGFCESLTAVRFSR